MINLMYIVLLAMLALNVSSDVLNGFALVEESLRRTTGNVMKENQRVFTDFEEQLRANPAKVKAWFDKARQVKDMSDSLYRFAEELKLAIAREADGDDADPTNLEHRDDVEAADIVMVVQDVPGGMAKRQVDQYAIVARAAVGASQKIDSSQSIIDKENYI